MVMRMIHGRRWRLGIIRWIRVASIRLILGIWRILGLWSNLIHLGRTMILILDTIYSFIKLFNNFCIFLLLFCNILSNLLVQEFQICLYFSNNSCKLILQHWLDTLFHCFSEFFNNHTLYLILNAFINTNPPFFDFFLLFL